MNGWPGRYSPIAEPYCVKDTKSASRWTYGDAGVMCSVSKNVATCGIRISDTASVGVGVPR